MKQAIIKNILFICMIANLISSSTHAGIGDWIARKKQQSKEYVLRKIGEAEQKSKELLASLRANKNCLVRGDCPAAKRQQLRALVGSIAATVAIVSVAAVVSKFAKDEKVKGVSITQFLPGYVPDDSEQGIFMKAVQAGIPEMVKQYADLVQQNVLDAGTKMSRALTNLYSSPEMKKKYKEVGSVLREAGFSLREGVQKSNEYLLNAVRQEDQELVTAAYCASPTPSKNALHIGIEILVDRGKKYTESVYQEKIVPIINFLRNPRCAR